MQANDLNSVKVGAELTLGLQAASSLTISTEGQFSTDMSVL